VVLVVLVRHRLSLALASLTRVAAVEAVQLAVLVALVSVVRVVALAQTEILLQPI
jgi:hypothetical protein